MRTVKTPKDAKGPGSLKILKKTSSSVYASRMPARSARHMHHSHTLTSARQVVRIDRQPWEERVANILQVLEEHRYGRANALYTALNSANQAMEDAMKKKAEVESYSEELQAANEEMRAANEEARAQAEEMRAANEELRAVSEELERMHSDVEKFTPIAEKQILAPMTSISDFLKKFMKQHDSDLSVEEKNEIESFVNKTSDISKVMNAMINYWGIELEGASIETIDSETVLEFALEKLEDKINRSDARITYKNFPFVVADENQLLRLFEVLIENAIDFSTSDPEIHLQAEDIGKTSIEIPEPKIEQGWIFSIKDNGIGIQQEALDNIFKIFQKDVQEAEDHLGMGLAVAWRIVKRHGGNIWIESQPDKGTTVFFTIPEYDTPENSR